MARKLRAITLIAASAMAAGATFLGAVPAAAGTGISTGCSTYLVTTPVTIGVSVLAGNRTSLCYSTTPNGSPAPETAGGVVYADVSETTSPISAGTCLASASDSGTAEKVTGSVCAVPTITFNQGPGTSGGTATIAVPFSVCAGFTCEGPPVAINQTGLIIGALGTGPAPGPGSGASLSLTALQVWVDGIEVENLGPNNIVGISVDSAAVQQTILPPSSGGPCVLSACVPSGYVETTGSVPVATIQIAGQGSQPVYLPHECIYQNPSGSCPPS